MALISQSCGIKTKLKLFNFVFVHFALCFHALFPGYSAMVKVSF